MRRVLPTLSQVSQTLLVTFNSWPRLSPTDELAEWQEDQLNRVFENIDVSLVFTSQELLDYFNRFLESVGTASRARVSSAV